MGFKTVNFLPISARFRLILVTGSGAFFEALAVRFGRTRSGYGGHSQRVMEYPQRVLGHPQRVIGVLATGFRGTRSGFYGNS